MKKTLLILFIFFISLFCVACNNNEQLINLVDEEKFETINYDPLTHLEVIEPIEARIIIVSIDNHPDARPHYGISSADIVYEVPAEGAIPRLLALFYSSVPEIIGPVRSARPYMVDIAREWESLFVHCGGSQDALNYLSLGLVDDMNEIAWGDYFWRDKNRYAPHNLMTSKERLYAYLQYRKMNTVQEKIRQFVFLDEEKEADGEKADWINVSYDWADNYYNYDSTINCYTRLINDDAYVEALTNDTLKISNIIVQKVNSHLIDTQGHLEIDMCAGGEAWLFTGGKVICGNWSRADLDSPTIFTDRQGLEFHLNPGQTWIEIIDQNASLNYRDSTNK